MPDLPRIILPKALNDNGGEQARTPPNETDLRRELRLQFDEILRWITLHDSDVQQRFLTVEKALLHRLFLLGRLFVMLFLCVRERRLRAQLPSKVDHDGHPYQTRPAQPRNLNTGFGVVRYFRTYVRGPKDKKGRHHGYYPLDAQLGLTADRTSPWLQSLGARLATKLSFAQAHLVLGWILLTPPSTEVLEQTVLGLARRSEQWFESAPPPDEEQDGEVLVIQTDGKCVPTATEEELARRRGKRNKTKKRRSPRHRGRDKRQRYGSKQRRKKGDKSKNGKQANLLVMYTLRRSADGKELWGPINKWTYGSFASKRHVFAVARREADKRGFYPGSGKVIQIVTDGDNDFANYVDEYFPEAIHTIDVIHVIEYLWKAAKCLYREGDEDLEVWVEVQKSRLYEGREDEIVAELKARLEVIPKTGPGNKGRRERLGQVIGYVEKRLPRMNYATLIEQDLELSSGAIEGAVKHLVGLRMDHGGMRWIKERAEALLKLRCIEANGDWDRYVSWVYEGLRDDALSGRKRIKLQRAKPEELHDLAEMAS